MRSERYFATTEERKNLTEIKTPDSKTFTKEDFLSAAKLVKELGLPKSSIEKAMKDMKIKKTQVIVNGHRTPVIIGQETKSLKVHPMGLSVFKEYILKQNGEKK